MFDPNYVPDVVDLILVHDENFDSRLLPNREFKENIPELEFRIRKVREGIIRSFDVPRNKLRNTLRMFPDYHKELESFTRDSVICFHGCMDLSGLEVAYRFVHQVDSRMLVMVGPNYAGRHSEKFRRITGFDYRDDWPCDPSLQLGLITDTRYVNCASGSVWNYFQAMAALRGKR